jgi:hypothetical protein
VVVVVVGKKTLFVFRGKGINAKTDKVASAGVENVFVTPWLIE